MSSIFLSHNHNDKPFVKRLAAMLTSEGITVWIDEGEIGLGESLLEKIEYGIKESKFVGVVISSNSVNSNWVKKELEMAMTQEIISKKIKVLPIICERCDLPLYLQTKLNADFTDPKTFHISFEKLVNAIREQNPPLLLSAREALLTLKGQKTGIGNLVGISQQGINQQYINLSNRKNWNSADIKSGRSRIWVAEYFNQNTLEYNSFGIRDGKVTEYPTLSVNREDLSKIQTVNFVLLDSLEILEKAIESSRQRNINLDSLKDIIILTRMSFNKKFNRFIWRIMFYDIVLVECIYALDYAAESGELILEYNMKQEVDSFQNVAKQWTDELIKKGVLKNVEDEVIEEMILSYARRIEDCVLKDLIDKLEQQNKIADFEKRIDTSSSEEIWKYLHDHIPNVKATILNSVANAKSRIIGNIDNL